MLAEDRRSEDKLSLAVARAEIENTMRNGNPLGEDFIEQASAAVHEAWLKRNLAHATEQTRVPYESLTEEEKEKDRRFVRAAIAEGRGQ